MISETWSVLDTRIYLVYFIGEISAILIGLRFTMQRSMGGSLHTKTSRLKIIKIEVSNQKNGATAASKLAWKQNKNQSKRSERNIGRAKEQNKLWEEYQTTYGHQILEMQLLSTKVDFPEGDKKQEWDARLYMIGDTMD